MLEIYSKMELDKKDISILEHLKKNAKYTTQDISKLTNIPITTIHNRIKKLESNGVIKNYTVNLNYNKLYKYINSILLIQVNSLGDQEEICARLTKMNEVYGAYIVTGDDDIIIRIRVNNVEELHNFIMEQVRGIKGVQNTKTLIVLKEF